jgi:energy-coupling factor transport system ATP-binding protein
MIEIDGLAFRYPGGKADVLNGLDLRIPEGSVIAVMGSNGSGKSTLARCLNGLLLPSSGRVVVDGMDTSVPGTIREVRRRVGMVFQNPQLQMTSATVERELAFGLENLGVEPKLMRERVVRQAREFGFDRCIDALPTSLSGGEQQRLAVAAVLLLRPRYLILDEATSLLSVPSRRSVLDAAFAERSRRAVSVILITQFPSEALRAERLLILHGGRVVVDGVPETVFERRARELNAWGVAVPLRYHQSLRA